MISRGAVVRATAQARGVFGSKHYRLSASAWDLGPTGGEKWANGTGSRLAARRGAKWMMRMGYGRSQAALKRVHQPRAAESGAGELVQIDGCEQLVVRDRGPQCTSWLCR